MKEPFFQCKTALPDQAFTHGAKFHSDDVFVTHFAIDQTGDSGNTRF